MSVRLHVSKTMSISLSMSPNKTMSKRVTNVGESEHDHKYEFVGPN